MVDMRYSISPRLMHETIDGEAIMIDCVTGNYYSLDRVGSEIWRCIERQASADEIADFVAARYEATRAEIEDAVGAFLKELEREDLIVPGGVADGAAALPSDAVARTAFRAPALEKHTDMQDLILLDPVHEVDAQRGWPHVNDQSAA